MFFKSLFSCDRYPNGEIFFFILMKHLVKCATIEWSPDHWWVTTYTSGIAPHSKNQLNGHQIIGELRPSQEFNSCCCIDWMVTRSLVSYDKNNAYHKYHRLHWMVTRSLVSYDYKHKQSSLTLRIEWSPDHWWVTTTISNLQSTPLEIEWSPDHWWVTTIKCIIIITFLKLNGHQIIGELRPIM